MGRVDLTVADADRERRFYREVIGLPDELGLVGFHGDPTARAPDPHATGLFHMAILLPTRRDLALSLVRLGRAGWPLSGASDHLVSEALYLSDPEGNGIEIYRDRPREEWSRRDGQLELATLPLDLRSVLAELADAAGTQPLAPPGTKIGQVPLQVSDMGANG